MQGFAVLPFDLRPFKLWSPSLWSIPLLAGTENMLCCLVLCTWGLGRRQACRTSVNLLRRPFDRDPVISVPHAEKSRT